MSDIQTGMVVVCTNGYKDFVYKVGEKGLGSAFYIESILDENRGECRGRSGWCVAAHLRQVTQADIDSWIKDLNKKVRFLKKLKKHEGVVE